MQALHCFSLLLIQKQQSIHDLNLGCVCMQTADDNLAPQSPDLGHHPVWRHYDCFLDRSIAILLLGIPNILHASEEGSAATFHTKPTNKRSLDLTQAAALRR